MSGIAGFFVHPTTIITPATTTDRYGATIADWDTATSQDVLGWVTQTASTETLEPGRDRNVTRWEASYPAGTAITGACRVQAKGHLFEVDGDPQSGDTPGGEHHVVAVLQVVGG